MLIRVLVGGSAFRRLARKFPGEMSVHFDCAGLRDLCIADSSISKRSFYRGRDRVRVRNRGRRCQNICYILGTGRLRRGGSSAGVVSFGQGPCRAISLHRVVS